jgi:hypothetical protein
MSDLASALAGAVLKVTKDWSAVKKAEERDRRTAEYKSERYYSGRSPRITIKDAAYRVMKEAYSKASGGGRYPANARQIMYAARPMIQQATGRTLDDVYFTQVLLPEYVREHPDLTGSWDVVYDARGHLLEPHTGKLIGLGTLEVRKYLSDAETEPDAEIAMPKLETAFPTCGPSNRYRSVLYIEKEGFLPLLEQAAFGERYDMAIMSSKGMGTTAARALIERLSDDATIYVLHDFDKAGFSILGTLTRDTRRYEFLKLMEVVDLGLRLADVEAQGLQSEMVHYGKTDPEWNLRDNGANDQEIAFLRRAYANGWRGQRVELNALTSDQFVNWLDSKLAEHGARKLIPDEEILQQAYRRAVAVARYQEAIDKVRKEISAEAAESPVPADLAKKIGRLLKRDPELSWDQAIVRLAGRRKA